MAIVLKKSSTFTRDVEVFNTDNTRGTLTVTYHYFDRAAVEALTKEEHTDVELFKRIVKDVAGMLDENNKPHPPEVQFEEALSNLAWTKAITERFLNELVGAGRKNSR